MYPASKPNYPSIPYDNQRRHSSYGMMTRRADGSDSDSEYGADPPYHAYLTRASRHSTFPPSAYCASPQQKQVQPYHQQPYIHPAMPPQLLSLESAPSAGPLTRQYAPRPGLAYEPPQHTYRPPTADPPRPHRPLRAESWPHSVPSESGSDASRLSRKGSRSVPPASRSVQDEARERAKDKPHGPWQKAKQIYKDPTVTNTAEIAMFGLLAVAKAL